jgi:murein DD-endopeptidase MepM/ murein hydrolase activator NlpD
MVIRLGLLLALFAAAACGPRTTPAPVHDANSNLGGVVLVRQGDTAWGIARKTGVPVRDLIEANGLQPPYTLHIGQRLFVPDLRLHRVAAGESLSTIAERYDVGRYELARLNEIGPPHRVHPRQILRIPGGSRVEPATRVARAVTPPPLPPPRPRGFDPRPARSVQVAELPAQPSEAQPSVTTSPAAGRTEVAVAPRPPAEPPAPPGLIWPVSGRVISGFGPKPGGLHNDGVNIAAPRGTRVVAAESGTVVYAGNELRGFGNLILIRHGDGLTTAYAHLDDMLVERGRKVSRGDPIATVGTSGGVNPAQLHFEIRKGRKALDPRKELGSLPVAASAS